MLRPRTLPPEVDRCGIQLVFEPGRSIAHAPEGVVLWLRSRDLTACLRSDPPETNPSIPRDHAAELVAIDRTVLGVFRANARRIQKSP
jgi:hypothetical protein